MHFQKQTAIPNLSLMLNELRSSRMNHSLCHAASCLACCEELGLKMSVINRHMYDCQRNIQKLRKSCYKNNRESRILLKNFRSIIHKNTHLVKVFLKINRFTGSRWFPHSYVLEFLWLKLSCFIGVCQISFHAFIHEQEQSKIKEEITGIKVSIIFDRTTRFGEAMAIIIRFIDSH